MLEGRSVHEGCSNAIFAFANKGALDTKWVTISPKYAGLPKYGDISKHLFSLSKKGGITVSVVFCSCFFFLNFNRERKKKPFGQGHFFIFPRKITSLCAILALLLQQKYSFSIFWLCPLGDIIISCFPDVLVFLNHTFSLASRSDSKLKNVIPSGTALLSPQEVLGFCSLQTCI